MSRRRGLHPEERALWEQVARSATPMQGRERPPPRATPAPAKPAAPPTTAAAKAPAVLPPDFTLGSRARGSHSLDLARPITEALREAPVAMDRRQFQRMNRGRLEPEARLDLHSMTLARAREALTGFIASARARGFRLVLVITGKGRDARDDGPIPQRRGALRHEVPHWLRAAPLGPAVLDIRPAHRKHGGDGALYVYLRRRR